MITDIFKPALPKGSGDHIHWGNLHGSSLAMAIAYAQQNAGQRLLLVTPDTPSAHKLEQELSFFTKASGVNVNVFPDWETLPYDTFSPHQDIISQRLETLFYLTQPQAGICIVPISTLLTRLAPVDYLGQYLLLLKSGDVVDIEQFRTNLNKSGYNSVSQVMEHGEYAIRGSIIDLYPMGSRHPLRIDLFDDEIETIRLFDPETQRSGEKVESVRLLPAHEFPTDKAALERFRQQFVSRFDANNSKDGLLNQVTKGLMPGGIEYYLPLFFENTATLFDYLHQDTLLIGVGDLKPAIEFYWADLNERYEQRRYDPLRPLLPPADIFLREEEVFGHFKRWPRISLHQSFVEDGAGRFNFDTAPVGDIAAQSGAKQPLANLKRQLNNWQAEGIRVLFSAETAGRRETLLALLGKHGLHPTGTESLQTFVDQAMPLGICVGWAENSFLLPSAKLAFITETQLLGQKVSQRRRREKQQTTDESAIIRNLAELCIGQPVVHLDHGVGRYLGLQTLDAGGIKTEFLTIEYAKEAKLYVPVASLHLISRYSGGDDEHAPVHHLGSDAWAKARKKAAEKVRDVAAQLLDIYAKRAVKPGFAHPIDWDDYRQFADSFPFEETPDQEQAINAVLNDMGSPTAMDRLVCGDVGFGKTEVAMRAAFIAAHAGKQVAVLVPTTLLAQQHFENFKDRFADWRILWSGTRF